MQREIDAEMTTRPALPIEILGVNDIGHESANALMVAGRTLPWLQDIAPQSIWAIRWRPEYRDVFVLDALNRKITAYNLTMHDLEVPANYQELKTILKAAATPARAN